MANLFQQAAAKPTGKTAAKKPSKPEVILDKSFNAKLKMLLKKEHELAILKAECNSIQDELKIEGKQAFKKMLKGGGNIPTSFILRTVDEKGVPELGKLFIVMDKYTTIDEERLTYLKETYPKQALTTMQTTYAFNPELIEKYADAVSDAIFKSKSIPDEDKINLIVATKEPRIAKNTINTLSGAKNADVLFDEIAPIVALKDTK